MATPMKFGSSKDQPRWLGNAVSSGQAMKFNAPKPPVSAASVIYNNPNLSPESLKNLVQAYTPPVNQPVQDLPVVPPVNSANPVADRGPAAPGMQWVKQPDGGYKQFAIPGYVAPTITTTGQQQGGAASTYDYLGDIYDPTAAKSIIEKMAQQGLLSAQDAEKAARERLGVAETESEARIRRETETQNQLLNTMFEPQRQQLAENLKRTVETADLTSASVGSVRGSRQADKVIQLNQAADSARAALDAQQQAQLRLYQAQLRGAEAGELKAYQDSLANAEKAVTDAQDTFALAQQGVLESQLEVQKGIMDKKAEDLKTYLDETGQVLDPTTGMLIDSLSGKERQSKIDETMANSILKEAQGVEAKANAAKLLDAITRGNFVTNSFSDEFGNTSIQVFNADTGASEIIDVGKISKPAAELLKAMYGKASGGGSSGGGGGGGSMSALAASLLEQGITSQQVALMGADAVPGLDKLPQAQYIKLIDDMRAGEAIINDALNAGKVQEVQKAGGVFNFITNKLKYDPISPQQAREEFAEFVGGESRGNSWF